MTRLEANRKILEKLAIIVEREPDLRFHQLLQDFNVEQDVTVNKPGRDRWYDESEKTLRDLENAIFYHYD